MPPGRSPTCAGQSRLPLAAAMLNALDRSLTLFLLSLPCLFQRQASARFRAGTGRSAGVGSSSVRVGRRSFDGRMLGTVVHV